MIVCLLESGYVVSVVLRIVVVVIPVRNVMIGEDITRDGYTGKMLNS